ncbi:DedA family protein [Kineococcus sp. NUM-3379]
MIPVLPSVSELLAHLAELPFPVLLAVAGALVLAECTIGLGFLVPGEAALLAAATTATDPARAVALVAVVTVCAIAGDAIGYALGRRHGARLLRTRWLARHAPAAGRATAVLRRHGAWAVLGARFLPVLRTLVPATAGVARLRVAAFALASVTGAALWAAAHVGLGATLGELTRRVEGALGTGGLLAAAGLLAALVLALRYRSRPSVGSRGPRQP